MNLISLPLFILFFAIVYLSIVYGLLKLAEAQARDATMISHHAVDNKQQIDVF